MATVRFKFDAQAERDSKLQTQINDYLVLNPPSDDVSKSTVHRPKPNIFHDSKRPAGLTLPFMPLPPSMPANSQANGFGGIL